MDALSEQNDRYETPKEFRIQYQEKIWLSSLFQSMQSGTDIKDILSSLSTYPVEEQTYGYDDTASWSQKFSQKLASSIASQLHTIKLDPSKQKEGRSLKEQWKMLHENQKVAYIDEDFDFGEDD